MKTISPKSKVIDLELISNKLLRKYHDKFFVDDSLTNVAVLLLSLYLVEHKNNKAEATYDEVREIFISLGRKENNFRVALYRAKKEGVVKEKGKMLSFSTKGLKKIDEILDQAEGQNKSAYVIKSGEFLTSVKLFEKFLQENEIKNGEILLVDPYISPSTLYPFLVLTGKLKSLKILTSNIFEEEKLGEYKKKFGRETGTRIEIRKNLKIHDRWLISGEKCWSIGSSIKDLGNKDTIIKELKGVTNDLRELFDSRWNENILPG